MNVLISNDDGYLSEGIAVLARVTAEFANVRVVAPERDRSGVSNSLTLERPLQLKQAQNGFYYVNGTPTTASTSGSLYFRIFRPILSFRASTGARIWGTTRFIRGRLRRQPKPTLWACPPWRFP
ncbi:stationary phase survival protein SurE [Neisseria meningitidis]|nr:stationary phase survival protein SurE [Neisseria meningitidis]